MYDVIVIGGGPCGSVAAKETASHNLKTLLIDKKQHIGRPVHCTGLISKRAVETLKVSQNSILNEIKGAYVHFPNGKRITIGTQEIKAYVVDRETFDKELLLEAQKKGVEVNLETEALNICGNKIKIKQNGKTKHLTADVFIGAYGARYSKRNLFTSLPLPKKILYGLQITAQYIADDKNFVELFFCSHYSDCFFAWIVPINKELSKIGLACSNAIIAKKGLKNLIEHLKCKPEKKPIAGLIPIGPPETTVSGNILLCGDAAGQAKPTSGGGIYTGTLCSQIAAETVIKYLNGNGTLREYEKRWREQIGKELKWGMIAHQTLVKLNDTQLNKLSNIISQPSSIALIKKIGDIDYPSSLIKRFLSIPINWKDIIPILFDSLS